MIRAVRQGKTLPLGAGGEQDGPHARGLADADGRDRRLQVLHGVVDRQSRRDHPAGRIDVEMDILLRIFGLQKEQLGNDQIGQMIVDRRRRER